MEQIAKELIALMKQMDEIESLYNAKRDEMYNVLTNAALSTFECNGYRFQKTDEATVMTITRERLFSAMIDAGLSESIQQQIFLAARNESVRQAGLRVVKVEPGV
jgi:hypothetical protein